MSANCQLELDEQPKFVQPPLWLGCLFLIEGEGARRAGLPLQSNPYCRASQQHELWVIGWLEITDA
jgi:hypothetical protein